MTVRETEIPEGEGRTYAVNRLEGVTASAVPPSTRARGEPAVNETKMSDRELNERLAETVLGWRRWETWKDQARTIPTVEWIPPHGHIGAMSRVPEFCSSGDKMLQLIEKMRERGWHLEVEWAKNEAWVAFWNGLPTDGGSIRGESSADTLPRAVAEAAYAALTAEEKQ